MSKGKMAATDINSVIAHGNTLGVTVYFSNSDFSGLKQASDSMIAVVVNESQNTIDVSSDGAIREDGVVEITTLKELVTGDILTIFLAAKRADGTVVSNSSYESVIATVGI